MMRMTYVLATVATAGLIGVASFATAQGHEPTKGSTVTLTSCVEPAQKPGTYVLTHVADVPAHPPTKGGRVVYWLDKDTTKKLSPHVGHQIRVTATVTDVDKREMELKKTDDGMLVEIEGPGRDVRAAPSKVGESAIGRAAEKNDIKTTLVKLKVDKLDMVAASCPLAR